MAPRLFGLTLLSLASFTSAARSTFTVLRLGLSIVILLTWLAWIYYPPGLRAPNEISSSLIGVLMINTVFCTAFLNTILRRIEDDSVGTMDATLFFEEDYVLHPLLGISLGLVCLRNVSSKSCNDRGLDWPPNGYKQITDTRLAGVNVLTYSIWISRGAGLVLSVDGLMILLPMCRTLLRWLRPKVRIIPMDESTWFHRQVAYAMLVFTITHTSGHYVK